MAVRLGLTIPRFSDHGGVGQLFPAVVEQAREAENAGFDAVFVMDHFYQLPFAGSPEDPMLEAYTTLGALATATERVQLGTLVTGNTYRNPALLAKAITTLDVISQGRAVLGMGTGWYELEHRQLGFEFGTFTERFAKLDEALQIIVPMTRGQRPTFSGQYYHVTDALAEPRFRPQIPLLIGGSGEKKTIPMAARSFDHLNIIAAFDDLPAKNAAVQRSCEQIGRDPATLETTALLTAVVAASVSTAQIRDARGKMTVVGTAEMIAEQVQTNVLDAGIGGVILHVANYTPGVLQDLADALSSRITPSHSASAG
jgi:F420-dependent oxidoreductase-like protein